MVPSMDVLKVSLYNLSDRIVYPLHEIILLRSSTFIKQEIYPFDS